MELMPKITLDPESHYPYNFYYKVLMYKKDLVLPGVSLSALYSRLRLLPEPQACVSPVCSPSRPGDALTSSCFEQQPQVLSGEALGVMRLAWGVWGWAGRWEWWGQSETC